VLVHTVDGFQGGERDIIIMSFVRASAQRGVGFVADARRLNVAVTRGRHSVIMLGHCATLLRGDEDCSVRGLVVDAQERSRVKPVAELEAWLTETAPVA
ncbi:AAA domain-containing protein, partial [Tribonema minus]